MPAPPDDDAPSDNPEAEERIQFMLRLRARGIRDLRLLRALERAPRALFMPQRFADIAAHDIALPIGGGQTSPAPSMVAAMIEALECGANGRALEIGAGSGYAAALLAQLCREVVSLERQRPLALEATARLTAFGLDNVKVQWADGLAFEGAGAKFDSILIHALIEAPPPRLAALLNPGGALVAVVAGKAGADQRILRWTPRPDGSLAESERGAARGFRALAPGVTGGS
jgi:protein-L-isoaspartate(D-aspartate) O-methyltransferase